MILSASSPFFQRILKENKHSHPLIYMKGMKSEDLTAIVDFLYFGEAKVYQENLDIFLAIAGELELNGLEGSIDQDRANSEEELKPMERHKTNLMEEISRIPKTLNEATHHSNKTEHVASLALPKTSVLSAYLQELDETVKAMMETRCVEAFITKGNRGWCTWNYGIHINIV